MKKTNTVYTEKVNKTVQGKAREIHQVNMDKGKQHWLDYRCEWLQNIITNFELLIGESLWNANEKENIYLFIIWIRSSSSSGVSY